MSIKVTPLSDALGAEISGVDLSKPLDQRTVSEINEAWMEHLVVVFRDQHLTDDDQAQYCGYFGTIGTPNMTRFNYDTRSEAMKNAKYPTTFVGNVVENGVPLGNIPDGRMMFHRDGDFTKCPFKGTTLYAIEVPDKGGNTMFSNQYSVYNALSDSTREKLVGMDIYNTHEFGITVRTKERNDGPNIMNFVRKALFHHPETGRMIAAASELYTEEIVGMPADESRAILDEIFALQSDPRFVYEHIWQPNDLVVWDNYSTIHGRTDFSKDQRRLLRRMTIAGLNLEDYS